MGLFNKKPKVLVCDMCGKDETEGCGRAGNHAVRISPEEPSWLPMAWRAQGFGQYTFLCTRCNAYPEMKWPGEGGAAAGIELHLGRAHHVGTFATATVPVGFEMRPVQ